MTRTTVFAVVLLGCGATPAPAPKHETPAPPPVVAAKPPPPSPCEVAAQALVKEHGIDKIPAAKRDLARRAGEAEVIAACLDDQWPSAAIDCMTSRAGPSSCFGQLEAQQERRISRQLDGWVAKWNKPDPTGGAAYGGDTYGGDDSIGRMGRMTPPPKDEEYISCSPSIGEPANYEPIIKPDAPDREYALKWRRDLLHETCNMRWSNTDKKCFGAASAPAAIAACRTNLDEASRNAITNSLADAAAKLQRLEVLKKSAKAIDCKTVALAHYSDDAWAGKLATLTAAERTRVITESRTKMAAACTADKWAPIDRACIVSSPRQRMDMGDCFPDSRGGMMFHWGFPASGVLFKSGIPDCDVLGEIMKKLASCDKLEKEMRENLLDMYGMQLGMWTDIPASSRVEVAKQCRDSAKMYNDHGKDKGCAM
jgi:hypothetical protein